MTNLWRDQYTRHVPERLREAFEADYRSWQEVKELLGKSSLAALMLPGTGERLDHWATRAADWSQQFESVGVTPSAPIQRPPVRKPGETTRQIVWGIAASVAGLAAVLLLARLPGRST